MEVNNDAANRMAWAEKKDLPMLPNKWVPHMHESLLIIAHINNIFKHLQGINASQWLFTSNSKSCNRYFINQGHASQPKPMLKVQCNESSLFFIIEKCNKW